jgi:hypothetical protein
MKPLGTAQSVISAFAMRIEQRFEIAPRNQHVTMAGRLPVEAFASMVFAQHHRRASAIDVDIAADRFRERFDSADGAVSGGKQRLESVAMCCPYPHPGDDKTILPTRE